MSNTFQTRGEAERTDAGRYWDEWNREWRFQDRLDGFMQRQLDIALEVARNARLDGARILGVGCGTGWLENGLRRHGEVWGTDLSPEAIAEGRRRYPGVHLVCGDFLRVDLSGPFDLVVSADSFAQMADHRVCVERIAALLRPGGTFLLMTQNPRIWRYRSKLRPLAAQVPNAALEDWPSLRRIRTLLHHDFSIDRVQTVYPGGDRGRLWWVENPGVERTFARVLGQYRWRRLLEAIGLGRELVIVARRRAGERGVGKPSRA